MTNEAEDVKLILERLEVSCSLSLYEYFYRDKYEGKEIYFLFERRLQAFHDTFLSS